MIGAIAGDIAGSIYEQGLIKTKEFPLFSEKCQFTDDTVHTVALAESILTGVPYVLNLKKFYRLYPYAGYGYSFQRWAKSSNSEPYNSWGNGAAMRISPVGFAYNDLRTVRQKAVEFTEITHNHPEALKGAQAVASAIFLSREKESKDEIRKYIEDTFQYNLGIHTDEIRKTYRFDVSCQGTVPQAIRSFIDSTDYEDAIRIAISLGGDSDTLACITGGIAQAYYGGIPEFVEKKVFEFLDERLGEITRKFRDEYLKG